MMGLQSALLISSISLVIVAYFLYCPVPENIQEPWKFQLLLGVFKATHYLTKLATFLGYDSLWMLRTTVPMIFITAAQEPSENVKVTEAFFSHVKVRIYEPVERRKAVLPGLIYYHGGGFIMFSVDTYDKVLRQLCIDAHIVIIAPEYRLSPEHRFPAPINDCIDASVYFLQHATDYGVDRDNIGVAGDSAGGNLAAAASYQLVSNKNMTIKYQIVIYPEIQAFNFKTKSMVVHDSTLQPLMTTEAVALAFALYWKGTEGYKYIPEFLNNNHISEKLKNSKYAKFVDRPFVTENAQSKMSTSEVKTTVSDQLCDDFFPTLTNPLYSPLMAEDLSRMPPAFIIVGEYDVLCDDGIMYKQRLEEAGVDVTLLHRDDGFHAMFSFTRLKIGREMLKEVVNYISSNKHA